jgi:hypothetical protein
LIDLGKLPLRGLTGYAIWAQEKKLPLGQEALMMLSVESHLLLLRMKNARTLRTAKSLVRTL